MTFFHMQCDMITKNKYAWILPSHPAMSVSGDVHQGKERVSIKELWKGIWHPLSQKAFSIFPAQVCILLPQCHCWCSRLQIGSVLCFLLWPPPPACTPGFTCCSGGDHHRCRQLPAAAQGHQVVIYLTWLLWWLPNTTCWPNHLCRCFLSEVGVGSLNSRCYPGWSGRGCLQLDDWIRKHPWDRGAVANQMGTDISIFQPAWVVLELILQPESSILREKPRPQSLGESKKCRLFYIFLGEGGAGQVSALGSSHPGSTGAGGGLHDVSCNVESGLWWTRLA